MFGSPRLPRSPALETVAALVARAEVALATWQTQLALAQAPGGDPVPPAAADLGALAAQLPALDVQIAELVPSVQAARRDAGQWAERTVAALREGRDDLAAQALARQRECDHVAQALGDELTKLHALRAAAHDALAAAGHGAV